MVHRHGHPRRMAPPLPRLRWLAASHAVTALVCLTLGAMAAPITYRPMVLPDAIRSMAELERVRVVVEPMSPEFQDLGLTPPRLRIQITHSLERAGIEVVTDDDLKPGEKVPLIALHGSLSRDPSVQDATGVLIIIKLEQHAHIKRLDEEMIVPTAFAWSHDIRDDATLETGIRSAIESAINRFVQTKHLNDR